MELLFQAWDELDDALVTLRQVLSRYTLIEIHVVASAIGALRRSLRTGAAVRRRSTRMRPA